MIVLHNLRGEAFALNADLIERVEGEPETHITLLNGTTYVVAEACQEVIRLHQLDRAEVQVLAGHVRDSVLGPGRSGDELPPLRLVEPESDDRGPRP